MARLNPRAGKFTPTTINQMERRFRGDHRIEIYLDDFPRRKILEEGREVIVLGGGDGTIKYEANNFIPLFEGLGFSFNEQIFAILKLGTGNGIAYEVGAGKSHLGQLEMILETDVNELPLVQIPLIEVRGTTHQGKEKKIYSMFTGAGWDGIVLKWYNLVKKYFLKGLEGYMGAVPPSALEILLGRKPEFEIGFPQGAEIAMGSEENTEFIDLYLRDERRFLQERKIHALVAGTTLYYGYNFVSFPYAERARAERKMHIRAVGGNRYLIIPEIIAHTLSIWKGEYRSHNIFEIIAPEVEIKLKNKEVSAQAGGDHFGEFRQINWKVSDYVLNLINYKALGIIS